MNLEDFYADVRLEVKSDSELLGDYEQVTFTNWALSKLADANEVIDLTESQYEGTGKNKKKIRIDAYGFDLVDSSLVCIISDYSPGESISTITKTEVESLFGQLGGFLETSLDDSRIIDFEHSSEGLQAAIELRSKFSAASKVKFYLVTNKKLSDRLKSLPSSEVSLKRLDFNVWDIERFMANQSESAEVQEVLIDLEEWHPGGVPALLDRSPDSPMQTYLLVIPGRVLATIYDRFGSRLLEGNVRSFLSLRGAVNKGIRSTIIREPEKFLAYNNGLSTTASAVESHVEAGVPRILKIQGLQIVNGGQTTASLFTFMRQEKQLGENLDKIQVQMKLIVVPQETSAEMVPYIARYANTQNRISEADFFSNSPFHVRMEEISKRIASGPRPGEIAPTKWFYERARGAYLNEKNKLNSVSEISKFEKVFPRAQVLTKTDFAKFSNSWNQKPHTVSKGAQKNFIEFANEVADKYSDESSRALFGEDYFKKTVAQAIIFNATHKAVRNSDWYESGFLANIVTYTLAKLSYELDALKLSPDWAQIWRAGDISEEFTRQLVDIARAMTGVLTDPTRPQKNVTEWAKMEKCWSQAKALRIELAADFVSALKEASAATKREERLEQKARGQALNEVELWNKLFKISYDTWETLLASNRLTVSPTQFSVIKLLRSGNPLQPKQMERVIEVLDRAKLEGLISEDQWH